MKFHLRDTDGVHIKCVSFAHNILDIDETHTHTHNDIYAYGILLAKDFYWYSNITTKYIFNQIVIRDVWQARANRRDIIKHEQLQVGKITQSLEKSLFRTFISFIGNTLYAGTKSWPYGAQRARVKLRKHQPRSKNLFDGENNHAQYEFDEFVENIKFDGICDKISC